MHTMNIQQLSAVFITFQMLSPIVGFSPSYINELRPYPLSRCQKCPIPQSPQVQRKQDLRRLSMISPVEPFTFQDAVLGSFAAVSVSYVGQFLRRQRDSADGDPYEILSTVPVYKVDGGEQVRITDMWRPNERAVVVFLRSFGCFFCQELAVTLKDKVKPVLDREGVRLVVIGIGKLSIAEQFCAHTGFPASNLIADPDSASYEALKLNKGAITTFFRPETPLALARRFLPGGAGGGDLVDALLRWKPWIPPKLDQSMQQGGILVFDGTKAVLQHYDPATGVHADLDTVLRAAGEAAAAAAREAAAAVSGEQGGETCGCAAE